MRKKALEIGCGQGFNSHWLSRTRDVVGIDICPADIAIARSRFPRGDYRIMDAGKLQFPDRYFDEVHALDVLEHVGDLDAVLREVKRVLKPGGRFLAAVPFHKSERWLESLRPTYFSEINHVRVFGECELEGRMGAYGFVVRKKRRADFLNHVFQYYMFRRAPRGGSQLGIGHWRDSWKTMCLFAFLMLFDTRLFRTPLVFFPVWVITLPIGIAINFVGNRFMPKALVYEFENGK